MTGEVAYLSERFAGDDPVSLDGLGSGRDDRFERMIQRHHARLRRFAASVLREPDRVDDVLQEAYLKAYRRLPRRFQSDAHEANWLVKVVFRCCLDDLRGSARRRLLEAQDEDMESVPAASGSMRMPIDRAFRNLSDADRAVLLLVDFVGFDYPEVGRLLDVPRGTVASRLNAARVRFREALVREGVRDARPG